MSQASIKALTSLAGTVRKETAEINKKTDFSTSAKGLQHKKINTFDGFYLDFYFIFSKLKQKIHSFQSKNGKY